MSIGHVSPVLVPTRIKLTSVVELAETNLGKQLTMATLTIEDIDIEAMVQEWIDRTDILEDVDVDEIVKEEIERLDLLDGVNLDKLIGARIRELVDDVEFHSYRSQREEYALKRIIELEQSFDFIKVEVFRLKNLKPCYKFW
jgi:hypothetical protein